MYFRYKNKEIGEKAFIYFSVIAVFAMGAGIGSIITKKNGMFVSADNDGNIRDAGVGNPIT